MRNEERKEIDMLQYWRLVVKRKWVIIIFTGTLVFFTAVFSFLATPQYRSTATLFLEEGSSKILSIDETFGFQPAVVRDLRFFNTQLRLLRSKSLAERVARKIDLQPQSEPDTEKKESEEEKPDLPSPSNTYLGLAATIQKNIEIRSIRDTKLVEVSFTSSSPVLAAEVVNTLTQEFINFSIEKRYATTQQASDFLMEQIATVRKKLTAKEQELQRYGQEKELFFLSDSENTAVNQFTNLNTAYTQAQIDRINTEAVYRELKDLAPDSLPQSVENPVIQSLISEYTKLKNDYEELSEQFKPDYPDMIRLQARLDSVWSEIRKAADVAVSEYNTALNRENLLKDMLEKQKAAVAQMDSNAILYNSIKIEVDGMRTLLSSLLEKQQETDVSARLGGLKTSSISIVEPGEVPKRPFSPNKRYNLMLAFLIGIFGGVGLCFVLDFLDNTVKGPEDVEKAYGLPSLGIIPYLPQAGMKKQNYSSDFFRLKKRFRKENPGKKSLPKENHKIELINHFYPKLSISEDYKTVRTSILLSFAENHPKTIVFTSASPKEGKTATVANMAVAFAELEERVLVVDSDLRKPRLHRIFNVKNTDGLSGVLSGKITLEEALHKTAIPNVWILPSGLIPPNPAELLNSKKMKETLEKLKAWFDIVLLDTTPVLAVIDAVILSSLADSTVLVIQAGKTVRKPLSSAVHDLKRGKARVMGVVFNKLEVSKGDYYFMDYYQYYRHQYYNDDAEMESSEEKVPVNVIQEKGLAQTREKFSEESPRLFQKDDI